MPQGLARRELGALALQGLHRVWRAAPRGFLRGGSSWST